MNRLEVLDILFKKVKYTEEEKEIIYLLEEAKAEWECARAYFDFARDTEMIDYAIHREDAAKVKYVHYLKLAKENNIKINPFKIISEI